MKRVSTSDGESILLTRHEFELLVERLRSMIEDDHESATQVSDDDEAHYMIEDFLNDVVE